MGETHRDVAELHELGTQLSEKLISIQMRLASVPYKCEHHVLAPMDGCVNAGYVGPHEQGVGFRKESGRWKLFYVESGMREDLTEDSRPRPRSLGRMMPLRVPYTVWRELSGASLVEKGKAASQLQRLHDSMKEEYSRRLEIVSTALNAIAELDKILPPADLEGE